MDMTRRTFLTTAAIGTAAAASNALALDKFGRDRDWTGNTPVTYPEPAWEVKDKRFSGRQGNATLQRIWHGMGDDASAVVRRPRVVWGLGLPDLERHSRTIVPCAGARTTAM